MVLVSLGVGTMRTRLPASIQLALCALKGVSSASSFVLIVLTILFAGGQAWTGGLSPMMITLLG